MLFVFSMVHIRSCSFDFSYPCLQTLAAAEEKREQLKNAEGQAKIPPPPPSISSSKPAKWIRTTTDDGKVYYYNEETRCDVNPV